jgi:hypothetical protein
MFDVTGLPAVLVAVFTLAVSASLAFAQDEALLLLTRIRRDPRRARMPGSPGARAVGELADSFSRSPAGVPG